MYNRYMNSGGFEDFFKPVEAPAPPPAAEPEVPVEPVEPTENKPKGLSSVLKNLTGGGLKLPEFDTDTLLQINIVSSITLKLIISLLYKYTYSSWEKGFHALDLRKCK